MTGFKNLAESSSSTPIKAWVEGVEVEDMALKQLRNTASLPFIFKHLAVMPDCHWGMGATIGSVIATKGAIVPASVGVDLGCFVGDTKVPLLDGSQKTLSELARRKKSFWVYSMDINLNIVPGRAVCKLTRRNASLVKVTVSGGDEIICTPDHRFMMTDGSYKEAQELSFNDSLMPLYRRWQTRDGYESIHSTKSRSGGMTHELVWTALNGPVPSGYVVHHDNHVHFDNRPENLRLMTVSAHSNKVICVEKLTKRANVYCLQVAKHHNFALAAGVFVHNCGMQAVQTSLTASDLPDTLSHVRGKIEAAVPHGRTNDGGRGDRGAWGELPIDVEKAWSGLADRFKLITDKHPKIASSNNVGHLGTLGTGNHFIEICLDEADRVWVMLHSGSRGVGGRIGSYFIELAKQDMKRWFINLPDVNLAYLAEGTDHFKDYCEAVEWAQDFALANRNVMMSRTLKAMATVLPPFTTEAEVVSCHHNYISRESHFGENVFVTRKGAVRAREGDMGIIPGSMGAKSYIVRGKGNRDSFCSCSHGAGRRMSRTEAKKRFTVEDQIKATEGVECRKDSDVIDEIPMAYKDVEAVMAAQSDLVEIVHTLKGVLCVKG